MFDQRMHQISFDRRMFFFFEKMIFGPKILRTLFQSKIVFGRTNVFAAGGQCSFYRILFFAIDACL